MAARTKVPEVAASAPQGSVIDAIADSSAGIRLAHLDPKTLTIAANIRTDVKIDQAMVKSIKENGVLVPILVDQTDTGHDVIDGQRRVLHAIEAGIATVPAVIRSKEQADAERLAEQIVVNDQREQLSHADRIRGYKQLAILGLSPAMIVRRTGSDTKTVKAALAVADSVQLTTALDDGDLDLTQAAQIAELGDVTPAELRDIKSTYRFDVGLEQVRRRRTEEAKREVLREQARADFLTIVEEAVSNGQHGGTRTKHQYVAELVDKETGAALSPADHVTCPGHAVVVAHRKYGEEDALHAVCVVPGKYGHILKDKYKAPLTAEEIAAKDAKKAFADAWKDATAIRQRFIREMLQRPKLPAGWPSFPAYVEAGHPHMYRSAEASDILGLLGVGFDEDKMTDSHALRSWLDKHAARAEHVVIAAAFARCETVFGDLKEIEAGGTYIAGKANAYFTHLTALGYLLTDVEAKFADLEPKAVES